MRKYPSLCTLFLAAVLFAAPAARASVGLRTDPCSKTLIDFIKGVAFAYGEAEGGDFLANGHFTYGANGLIEFAGSLNNNMSVGKLKIGLKLNTQCQVHWSEINSR